MRAGRPVERANTKIRALRWSSTYASPAASNATATGRRRIVGPGEGEPHTEAIDPSGCSSSMRPLIESATARRPPASAAIPIGVLN